MVQFIMKSNLKEKSQIHVNVFLKKRLWIKMFPEA